MKKTLLTAFSVFVALAAGMAVAREISPGGTADTGKAVFKTAGRTLQESSEFRGRGPVNRIPSKADIYGSKGLYRQSETAASLPLPEWSAPLAAPGSDPLYAEGERKALALMIYNDSEKTANSIIELPLKSGAVEGFQVAADKVPKMPYKSYGEYVVNAVAFDDQFMASTFCSMLYTQTNSVYTVPDWTHRYDYDYRVADLEATAISYSDADGICYGVFQGLNPETKEDDWFFGRWIDPSSYTQPEPISWLGADARWYGMAISPEGEIFAIDGDCNLLKVDKTDGSYTVIGATGLRNQYKTSACYDAVNNRILFATSLDQGSALCSIDPATARATTLYLMPHGEQVVGLFIPDPIAADKAPAAPTDLAAEFPLGSLSGNITFGVPDTYFDGTPASGTVEYTVWLDGKEAATGSASYGSTASAPVTMEVSANNVVAVRLSNSEGKSPLTRKTLFCGTPKPRAPYFSQAVVYNDTEKCFEISWSPSRDVSGQTGGTVNNDELSYELIRYPDEKVITIPAGQTSYNDYYTPPSDNFVIVYYTLCAVYHGTKSFYSTSTPTKFGIITPPYRDEMWNSTSGAAYSYLSTDNDKFSWSYIGAVTQQTKQHGWMNHGAANSQTPMDSYLLMPPLRLEKGKVYTLDFTAACTNTSWRNERMAVYMGREISETGLREMTLIPPTLVYERREEDGERHSCNFSAPDDGVYYIAFHHNSDPNLRYLYIGDISISAPVDGNVPSEVENLQVTAAGNGQLKATLTFDMPTKSVNGLNLTETTKIRIYRNDEKIADVTPAGNSYSYTDNNAANGVNNYVVVPYNSKGEGLRATANVFVGVGKPSNPSPHAWYGQADGDAEVTWPPVAQDEFGTALTSANVRYEVQREEITSAGATIRSLVGENITETSFSETYCSPDAEQTSAGYWVRAVTDGGVSQWVSTRKLGLGRPYSTPWTESFVNASVEYNWHTVGSSMTWSLVNDEIYDDVKSVDGDNGFFLCQAPSPNTTGLVYSGAIYIPEYMPSPFFSFYYLDQDKYQGTPVKNYVEMVVLDRTGQRHVKKAVCDGPWGWKRIAYDMSAYKGQKVQVGVYMECVDRPFVALDAFRIATRLDNDIDMVRITVPEEVTVGQDAVVTVSYENLGASDIPGDYTVQLYRDGQLVEETAGKGLRSDAVSSVNFTVKTNPTMGESPEFHAVVKFDNDDNPDNNVSNYATMKITNNIGYPEPLDLKADRTEIGVTLEWAEPDMTKTPRMTYTEDFESFDSFAREIPGWTMIDGDGGIVSPISNYIQTADSWGSPASFFVQDNSVEPFSDYEEFTTTSGCKYMASQLTGDTNGNPVQNDDWLISPELSGDRQIASFMGKSISSSWPESFEVYYSTTGTAREDFILIGGVYGAPNYWINYTASLPEGAKYFAIRCVSYSCLQFMIDDVTLRLGSCDPIELTLDGYNIYRDSRFVANVPIGTLSYLDTEADGDAHTYHVTALYKQGESTPSDASTVPSGIGMIGAGDVTAGVSGGVITVNVPDSRETVIISASGTVVHRGNGSCRVPVAPGVYMVKAGNRTFKLIAD